MKSDRTSSPSVPCSPRGEASQEGPVPLPTATSEGARSHAKLEAGALAKILGRLLTRPYDASEWIDPLGDALVVHRDRGRLSQVRPQVPLSTATPSAGVRALVK